MLVNGDTVHPFEVEQTLLDADSGADLTLAVDVTKQLTDEAMKVTRDDNGFIAKITKQMPVDAAHGEYIGASLITRRSPATWPQRWRRPGAGTSRCTTKTATRH